MSDDSSNNLLMKIGGAVFATIVAPLIVALGMKWFDSPQQQPVANTAATADAQPPASDAKQPAAAAPATPKQPATPASPLSKQVVDLFNGRDLAGFHVRSPRKDGAAGGESAANLAAAQNMFSVRNGTIHATGQHIAALVTDEEYSNYRLTLQFKWGDHTWPPREEKARVSGVLLHAQTAKGGGRLSGIRCVLGEGETGDLAVIGAIGQQHVSFTSTAVPQEHSDDKPRLDRFQYRPNAAPVEVSRGYVARLGHAPRWKDVKGFRGRRDMELPHGEWNTVECLCRGDRIEIRVNGKLVNIATHCSLARGRIVLQSIYAEVFFQTIQLEHLPADLPGT